MLQQLHAFFQGLLDNQTPAYNTKSIELVNNLVWKKETMSFVYFPGLGHALDPRDAYGDLQYSPMDLAAVRQLAESLSVFFRQ